MMLLNWLKRIYWQSTFGYLISQRKYSCIKIECDIPVFENREQVLKWIENMSEEQIAYVGF